MQTSPVEAMYEVVTDATAEGFILGLQVAEHLHGIAPGSTLTNDGFIGLMVEVAAGRPPVTSDNGKLVEAIPGAGDLKSKQLELRVATEQAAIRLMEWYRRQSM